MKKRLTSVFLSLTLVLSVIGGIVVQSNEASAAIYFAGKYKAKGGYLELSQYSSPESSAYGKNYGYYRFYGFKNKKKNTDGELYKKGKNKYQDREGFLTFIVKKKSVVVKGSVVNWSNGKTYSLKGTYKLKKRYPRP